MVTGRTKPNADTGTGEPQVASGQLRYLRDLTLLDVANQRKL